MTDSVNLSTKDINSILVNIRRLEDIIDTAKSKRDDSISFANSLIAEAKSIFDQETTQAFLDIESLKLQLRRFFDSNPPSGRKSFKFAAGSFGYNKSQTEFFLNANKVDANNADLIKFCANSGLLHFIKIKESLDWAALKKNLDFDDNNVFFADTGEIIPGLSAKKIFTVKTTRSS